MSLPASARIGEEGQGFNLAKEFLVHGRITYAAGTIGIAQHALNLAVDWVKQREVFGTTLAKKQGIRWMMADAAMELQAPWINQLADGLAVKELRTVHRVITALRDQDGTGHSGPNGVSRGRRGGVSVHHLGEHRL